MKKRVLSYVGALLGGFLFTIPWILVYIYGEMLFSILATFIAYGALLGYKKFGGEINKDTKGVIISVSLIVITITTLIIIPLCLLYNEGYIVSFKNLKLIYSISEFKIIILRDLIVSIVFTIIGISGVISKLKSQVDEDVSNKKLGELEKVKIAFQKYNATNKYSAVDKYSILNLINNDKALFNRLLISQIIKKYHGKYYFSEKAEKNTLYRFFSLYLKILAILMIIFILIFFLIYFSK